MENLIYQAVKDHPALKTALKFLYQSVFSLAGPRNAEAAAGTVHRPGAFFGFHDKSPWSADHCYLLAHAYDGVGNEEPTATPLEIVVFDGPQWTERHRLTQTRAWNWQMGAQLQWASGGVDQVVFNDFRDGFNMAVRHTLATGDETSLPYPIGAVSPVPDRYAGFCYQTLGRCMPGYGYDFAGAQASSPLVAEQLVVFNGAGRLHVDFDAGTLPAITTDAAEAGERFVTHTQFSPDGAQLAFLHCEAVGGRRLRSRLYCIDPQDATADPKPAPFHDMVSHFTWVDDHRILAFANTQSGDGFYIWDTRAPAAEALEALDLGNRDGHPHGTGDGLGVVVDRYPDRRRLMPLYWMDLATHAQYPLGRYYLPMRFWEEKRVDLHPRVRSDGAYIAIDGVHDGVRSLATLPVKPHG